MFSMPRVSDSDRYDARAPIPHEPFGTSVKDGLAAHNLGAGTIDLSFVSICRPPEHVESQYLKPRIEYEYRSGGHCYLVRRLTSSSLYRIVQ